jgi:alkylation response protein AidB-like acyl-CoA dehydrogenase
MYPMLSATGTEQRELVATVRAVLTESAEPLQVPWDAIDDGIDRSLWGLLAKLGLIGLGVTEDRGGSGGGLRELCLVAEQLGGVLGRVPFVGSAAVLAADPPDAASIADGSVIAVPAWETFLCLPRRHDGLTRSGTTVEGTLQAVAFGMDADLLLAFAGESAVLVDLAQPGVFRQPVSAFDVTEPVAAMSLSFVQATVIEVIEPEAFLARGLTVAAAELIGTGQRALSGAVDYAKQRHQFGRAIGSFQAIKHLLADRYVQLEAAALLVDSAITAVDDVLPDALVAARTALVAATEAAHAAAADALQVHGGIGFTWEHPSHLFLKRTRSRRSLFGSPDEQLAMLAAHIFEPSAQPHPLPLAAAVAEAPSRIMSSDLHRL